MIRYAFLAVIMTLWSAVTQGAVYKCVDHNGKTVYQGLPCEQNSQSEEKLKIVNNTGSGPAAMNKQNKRYFDLALYSDSMVFTAEQCRARNSSYADEVEQASRRLDAIRKTEIEAGKRIMKQGFEGFSAHQITVQRIEAKHKYRHKLSVMSPDELDDFCSNQARKARNLAANAPYRSSGYEEGDLDPEGND
ncbi:DUF4124 domain-containing protein [Motilimonas sp. KMU-193]|uniref:DUF4124 domain-containing protein n=1 Tax=Motilimonas sp. KMU-193 TaxID=3388668 RepID=UPI00396B4837